MSLTNFLVHGKPNGIPDADSAALFDSPEARPNPLQDIVLDQELLPLMRARGSVDWPTLLEVAVNETRLPQASLLRWLSEALHYRLVESDPANPGAWRLTEAGMQRVAELESSDAAAAR